LILKKAKNITLRLFKRHPV